MQLNNLSLSEGDKKKIDELLTKYSNNFDFYAFGSRVQGTAKKYSDLDLAYVIKGENNLFLLEDEIVESDISITIDFVNLDDISKDFRDLIDEQMLEV
ncbi:MAG: nucleotidyltransferase domain-containing protein [Halobacteriovoraceae bacterium]|jgi:uncharacterized protein|nr:nucleotidyltransferase domain-containing protein [Halobacteriovoraceae bacterium]